MSPNRSVPPFSQLEHRVTFTKESKLRKDKRWLLVSFCESQLCTAACVMSLCAGSGTWGWGLFVVSKQHVSNYNKVFYPWDLQTDTASASSSLVPAPRLFAENKLLVMVEHLAVKETGAGGDQNIFSPKHNNIIITLTLYILISWGNFCYKIHNT